MDRGDVREASERLTLIMAMHLAAERDRIATPTSPRTQTYSILPCHCSRTHLQQPAIAISRSRRYTWRCLAEFLDTHIVRKHGQSAAEMVREEARALELHRTVAATAKSLSKLAEYDANLKSRGLNPGTTADFVVATLFVAGLIERKPS